MKDYLYLSDDDGDRFQTRFKVSKTPAVERLINESKFGEALNLIDEIIESDESAQNFYLKARILVGLLRFDEAIRCFDKSLSLEESGDAYTQKANAFYQWAKITYFPDGDFSKALLLIDSAIKTAPDHIDLSEFYFLKAEILEGLNKLVEAQRYYLMAHGEFERLKELDSQIEYLKNTSDDVVVLTGSHFYDFTPKKGMIVDLIAEVDNEHDSDAVAVYFNGSKIAYLANSPYTLVEGAKSASDVKNKISDDSKAEIIFIYLGEYVMARLI